MCDLVLPRQPYRTLYNWEGEDEEGHLVGPMITWMGAHEYAARRECYPMMELAIKQVSSGMDHNLIKQLQSLMHETRLTEDYLHQLIKIFEKTKEYRQSLNRIDKITRDVDFKKARMQWLRADTTDDKISITKTFLMKNSVEYADLAEYFWNANTELQSRWSQAFFQNNIVAAVHLPKPSQGQDALDDAYSGWMDSLIGMSLRGGCGLYPKEVVLQHLDKEELSTIRSLFDVFARAYVERLRALILDPDLSPQAQAITILSCRSQIGNMGFDKLGVVTPEERLGFISRFLQASPEQQEKMRHYKVQGATLVKVFVSLFLVTISWTILGPIGIIAIMCGWSLMQPFNLLAQGHRLLMDSVRFVIDRQTSPGQATMQTRTVLHSKRILR